MDIAHPITCLVAKQIGEAVVPPVACRGYNAKAHRGCYWTGRPGADVDLHEMGCAHATNARFSELAQRQVDMEQQLQRQTEVIEELTTKVTSGANLGVLGRETPHPVFASHSNSLFSFSRAAFFSVLCFCMFLLCCGLVLVGEININI